MLVSRPSPNRQNKPLSVDVDEARRLQPVVKLWACAGFHAFRAGGLDEFLIELLDFATFEATVCTRPLDVEIDELGVATRLGVAADLSDRYSITLGEGYVLEAVFAQTSPVADCGTHVATVDIVKWLLMSPIGFDVVNFEAYVWWYP